MSFWARKSASSLAWPTPSSAPSATDVEVIFLRIYAFKSNNWMHSVENGNTGRDSGSRWGEIAYLFTLALGLSREERGFETYDRVPLGKGGGSVPPEMRNSSRDRAVIARSTNLQILNVFATFSRMGGATDPSEGTHPLYTQKNEPFPSFSPFPSLSTSA